MAEVSLRRFVACAFAAWLAACSADSAPEPEPTLETPGAFVAVQTESGGYRLHRILTVLVLENDERIVFATVYQPEARDFVEAEVLARRADLPELIALTAVLESALMSRPWKVVWFRTLTDEELDVVL